MPTRDTYFRQAALMMRALPFVAEEDCFALKGGTAINFFHRNLPRLSVDIDLTYLPMANRAESLKSIDQALKRIGARIQRNMPGVSIQPTALKGENTVVKLLIREKDAQIKIEVTPVLRGSVFDTQKVGVCEAVENQFGFAEIQVLSFADLYGGKLVAAFDRQHPRDLFDVAELLSNEGVTEDIRAAFVVYLISHNRPMAEVLAPKRKNIDQEFESGFSGMTNEPVSLSNLIEAREQAIDQIVAAMPNEHRKFLVGFEQGDPDWSLLPFKHIKALPAVQWRVQNLDGLAHDKRTQLVENLERVLDDGRG